MTGKSGLELMGYFPKAYEKIASTYHSARFENRRGRYDLFETMKITSELYDELRLDFSTLKVLDVGCGTGKISLPLAKRGANVTCLDASIGMLKECRKNAVADCLEENTRWIESSAEAIPYAEGTFDLVISSRFLHLFPTSYYPALIGEMLRVVKQDGHVVIEITNKYYGLFVRPIRNYLRVHRKHRRRTGSSLSLLGVYRLPQSMPDSSIVSVMSCQLPMAHYFPPEFPLAIFLRALSRTLARPFVGFYYVALKK